VVTSVRFEWFVSVIICCVGITEVMSSERCGILRRPANDSEHDEWHACRATLNVLDKLFLGLFSFELIAGVAAQGAAPLRYFHDAWNRFDSFVVTMAYLDLVLDLGQVKILRLLRLLRVTRLLHSFPALRVICQAVIHAIPNVGYLFLLWQLINFLFAAIGMILFYRNDPLHFGTLNSALMAIWQVGSV
jgi:voltage-gated sodium channel